MADCLFCKIANKEINAKVVFENDHVVAFQDIRPAAPTHVLVIPRKHIERVDHATPEDATVLGQVLLGASAVAKSQGLSEGGFRIVFNNGEGVGQSVFHVHAHVLGGRAFSWPPG
jgi:histidine triad (HIT) family protein